MSEPQLVSWEVSFVTFPLGLVKADLSTFMTEMKEPIDRLSGPAIRIHVSEGLFSEWQFIYLQEAASEEEACRLVRERALELAQPYDGNEDALYEFKAVPHDANAREREWDRIREL